MKQKLPFAKLPKTKQKQLCDILFSQIVRTAGKCFKCNRTTGLQCAHIVSRSYHATRWDLDNAVCLCNGCHVYYTHHPLEWEVFICIKIGKDEYDQLKKRALNYSKPDYAALYEQLGGTL